MVTVQAVWETDYRLAVIEAVSALEAFVDNKLYSSLVDSGELTMEDVDRLTYDEGRGLGDRMNFGGGWPYVDPTIQAFVAPERNGQERQRMIDWVKKARRSTRCPPAVVETRTGPDDRHLHNRRHSGVRLRPRDL